MVITKILATGLFQMSCCQVVGISHCSMLLPVQLPLVSLITKLIFVDDLIGITSRWTKNVDIFLSQQCKATQSHAHWKVPVETHPLSIFAKLVLLAILDVKTHSHQVVLFCNGLERGKANPHLFSYLYDSESDDRCYLPLYHVQSSQ